jgi:hypothetical protein
LINSSLIALGQHKHKQQRLSIRHNKNNVFKQGI